MESNRPLTFPKYRLAESEGSFLQTEQCLLCVNVSHPRRWTETGVDSVLTFTGHESNPQRDEWIWSMNNVSNRQKLGSRLKLRRRFKEEDTCFLEQTTKFIISKKSSFCCRCLSPTEQSSCWKCALAWGGWRHPVFLSLHDFSELDSGSSASQSWISGRIWESQWMWGNSSHKFFWPWAKGQSFALSGKWRLLDSF